MDDCALIFSVVHNCFGSGFVFMLVQFSVTVHWDFLATSCGFFFLLRLVGFFLCLTCSAAFGFVFSFFFVCVWKIAIFTLQDLTWCMRA